PRATLIPYTTLFRSTPSADHTRTRDGLADIPVVGEEESQEERTAEDHERNALGQDRARILLTDERDLAPEEEDEAELAPHEERVDRKSTRLNSSHQI